MFLIQLIFPWKRKLRQFLWRGRSRNLKYFMFESSCSATDGGFTSNIGFAATKIEWNDEGEECIKVGIFVQSKYVDANVNILQLRITSIGIHFLEMFEGKKVRKQKFCRRLLMRKI